MIGYFAFLIVGWTVRFIAFLPWMDSFAWKAGIRQLTLAGLLIVIIYSSLFDLNANYKNLGTCNWPWEHGR
jgi:hypothetical protein